MTDITKLLTDMGKLKIEQWRVDKIIPYDNNPRKISTEAVRKVREIIERVGFIQPIIVDEDGVILAGHTRLQALVAIGAKVANVIQKTGLTAEEKRLFRIADNRVAEESDWDFEKLQVEIAELQGLGIDIDAMGFDADELTKILDFDGTVEDGESGSSGGKTRKANGSLAERFGIPPFTVLNARGGDWQGRKDAWLKIGLQSELGRGACAFGNAAEVQSAEDGADRSIAGTSIFDPVLCELVYRWFCPPEGVVIDPFAGGSVRGIVASRLGREYHGLDLSAEQCEANRTQLELARDPKPSWYCGDSRLIDKIVPRTILADLVFTCPPYANLEVYSDNPADLSTMGWPDFVRAYGEIIELAARRLKPCRFAVFVVGDVRGPGGNYLGLPWKTVELACAAGLQLYNEAVLVTSVGSLAMRAGNGFETSRKLGKSHQNVLVFAKGDAKAATRDIGACEFGVEDPAKEEAA